MNRQATFVSGMIVGAGLMYLLDPARGARRRGLLRDQVVHAGRVLEDLGNDAAGKAEDLRNRVYGAVAEARGRLRREEVDAPVLEARVRSEIGRAISNPHAVQVAVNEGSVTLSGQALEHEVEGLLSAVAAVRGVERVENRLEVHS